MGVQLKKEIYIGSEHLSKLGKIEIEKDLVTLIDLNFKNPNFPEVFAGVQPKNITKNKECNYSFELLKISKADFPFKKFKNNFFIVSDDLSFELPQKYENSQLSIKLNYLEYLKIKYYKKQTVFHEINLRKEWLKFTLFVIPSLFLGWFAKGCYEDKASMYSEGYKQKPQMEKTEQN